MTTCPRCGNAADIGLTRVYCSAAWCENFVPAVKPAEGAMPRPLLRYADCPSGSVAVDTVAQAKAARLAAATDRTVPYRQRADEILRAYNEKNISWDEACALADALVATA